jgi:hypothetical protein
MAIFDGHGVYTFANGDRYDGEWRDNGADGYGEDWVSGNMYRGNWVAGCYRDGNRRASLGRPLSECP